MDTNGEKKKNKLLLILLILLFIGGLLVVLNRYTPSKLLGNVYYLKDIESKIDEIKVGDTIKYEANGVKDWKVLYIDKVNNTVDIVSDVNAGVITLSGEEQTKKALNIFQEEANKYVVGDYAIKARSVTRSDLDNFTFSEAFWLADIYGDNYIGSSNGKVNVIGNNNLFAKYYMLPWVRYSVSENVDNFDMCGDLDINLNGVEKWTIIGKEWRSPDSGMLTIIPKDPIEIKLDNMNNIKKYIDEYINSIKNIENVEDCSIPHNSDIGRLNDYEYSNLRDYYKSRNLLDNIVFITYNTNVYSYQYNSDGALYTEERVYIDPAAWIVTEEEQRFREWPGFSREKFDKSATLGFRPVVTLNYSNKVAEGKETNTDIKVGDQVKYTANGYQNWKVLRVDEKEKTADIISGGVVKNLTLKGMGDYNNLEEVLKKEIKTYAVEGKAITYRPLEYSDIEYLRQIHDNVTQKYWLNNKKMYNLKLASTTSAGSYTNITYGVSVMSYDMENFDYNRVWATLYVYADESYSNSGGGLSAEPTGPSTYTAGLRPVITIKLSEIEKADAVTPVEDTTSQEIEKEQTTKNSNTTKPRSDKETKNTVKPKDEETKTEEPEVTEPEVKEEENKQEQTNNIEKVENNKTAANSGTDGIFRIIIILLIICFIIGQSIVVITLIRRLNKNE